MDITEEELQQAQDFLNSILDETRTQAIHALIHKLRQNKCQSALTIRYLERLAKENDKT